MTRFLIAAIALSLAAQAASAAQAAHKHKRHHVARHHTSIAARIPTVPADPYAKFYNNGPKPPWGAPQQCFTEEGYGRYWPCGAGPNGFP
jgi:hypothetical protein